MSTSIADAAERYRDAGFHTVALKPRSKAAVKTGWTEQAEPDTEFPGNVGLRCGDGGLVDVDLDTPAAAFWGSLFVGDFPAFGRETAPLSHRVAVCRDIPPKLNRIALDYDGEMLVELRCGPGSQTVFPPSIHQGTGEQIAWATPPHFSTMQPCEFETLRVRVGLIGLMCVVEKHYPRQKGSRDEVCMALSGALLRIGVEVGFANTILVEVARRCGDEEASKRGKAERTKERMDDGRETIGMTRLCELLLIDPASIERILDAIGSGGGSGVKANNNSEAAEKFVEHEVPTLIHCNDDWFAHDGVCYRELEEATVRSRVDKFLARCVRPVTNGDGDTVWKKYSRTTSSKTDVVNSLKELTHRPAFEFQPPCWLDGRTDEPLDYVVFTNGRLYVPSGRFEDNDPALFAVNALDFDYEPGATCPQWEAFVSDIFEHDPGCVGLVQEMFGYLVTPDTSQEKIFYFIGPKRSGKGTINESLRAVVGLRNCVSPSLRSLSQQFGLQPLVRKTLAPITDMRVSRNMDHGALLENMLRISGRDAISIPRKFKQDIDAELTVRFVIFTNPPVQQIHDASGVWASRLVPIELEKSFYGREDPTLKRRLATERAGIFNWALAGLRRLRARGHFELPESSVRLQRKIQTVNEPVVAFLEEQCVIDADAFELKGKVYDRFCDWCERNGIKAVPSKNTFCDRLYQAADGAVKATVPGSKSPDRSPRMKGLRLAHWEDIDELARGTRGSEG